MKIKLSSILITLSLCACYAANAQNQLALGSLAPTLKPFKWIKGEPVEVYQPGKVYVVEFGATWCTPCAAIIPELTKLQAAYRDQVTVVSLFVMEVHNDPPGTTVPSFVPKVEKYVQRQGEKMDYTVAVDDAKGTLENEWLKASERVGVPHTFIVDQTGHIAWIGSNPKRLTEVLSKVLNPTFDVTALIAQAKKITEEKQQYNPLKNKTDVKDVLVFAQLARYQQGQTGLSNSPYIESYLFDTEEHLVARQGTVQVLGGHLRGLYVMAYGDTLWNYPYLMYPPGSGKYIDTVKYPHKVRSYGKWWYRPILEVKDSALFESNSGEAANRFNYTLCIPGRKVHAHELQRNMQADLKTCFGYEVSVEVREMPCWYIVLASPSNLMVVPADRKDTTYKITYEGSKKTIINADIREIIYQLEMRYGYSPFGHLTVHPNRQPPFIDATGIKGKFDYSYNINPVLKINEEAKIRDTFEDYRKVLREKGFELVKGTKPMKVVVIRDSKKEVTQ